MLLHEAVGHGVGCLLAGGAPTITTVATQCEVQPLAMVLAGPLLNWAVGLFLWRALPAVSAEPAQRWWLLWLLFAYNLFVAAGYLVFCGLAGFGDWAVAAAALPAWLWRPVAVVGGAALYYLVLRAASARSRGSTSTRPCGLGFAPSCSFPISAPDWWRSPRGCSTRSTRSAASSCPPLVALAPVWDFCGSLTSMRT